MSENEKIGMPRGAVLSILLALGKASRTVNEIVAATGLSQPNVSNHLARLRAREWVQAERRGRRVSYRLADPALIQYVGAITRARTERESRTPPTEELLAALLDRYLAAMLSASEEGTVAVVEAAEDAGVGWETLYLRVFAPALERIGDLWAREGLSVAVEHAATALTLRMMHRLQFAHAQRPRAESESPAQTARYRALVACVPGELHALGARMVADFLAGAGWDVTFLGADLPATALLEAVARREPHAVLLSAATPARREAVADVLERLRAWRGERMLPLLVAGGQFFRGEAGPWPVEIVDGDLAGVVAALTRRLAVCAPLPEHGDAAEGAPERDPLDGQQRGDGEGMPEEHAP